MEEMNLCKSSDSLTMKWCNGNKTQNSEHPPADFLEMTQIITSVILQLCFVDISRIFPPQIRHGNSAPLMKRKRSKTNWLIGINQC